MVHKHEKGSGSVAKRLLGLCLALVMLCGVFVPTFASVTGVDGESQPQQEQAAEPTGGTDEKQTTEGQQTGGEEQNTSADTENNGGTENDSESTGDADAAKDGEGDANTNGNANGDGEGTGEANTPNDQPKAETSVVNAVAPQATPTVMIQDDIKNSGSFVANVTGGNTGDTYTYQWYKSDKSTTGFTKIENTSTVTGTEKSMFVARDGARMWYKVEVLLNGAVVATSAAKQVEYDAKLENGSFEQPHNNDNSYNSNAGPQYPEASVPYWHTTGKGTGNKKDHDIEIVSVGKGNSVGQFKLTTNSNYYNELEVKGQVKYTGVPDGTQCAELNCEAWGALYQDVLTVPGSTLHWSFYHRGRFGTENDQMDKMQLLIVNANTIQDNWTPPRDGNGTTGYQGEFSANALKWNYHSGSYKVPEGQYVTRFYFVSTESYHNDQQLTGSNATVGNLLDKITFGSEVPEPVAEKSNLTITKTVDESIKSYVPDESFTFEVKKGNEVVRTVKLPTTAKEWSITLTNLDPGDYTVTETMPDDLDDFTYMSTTITCGTSSSNGTTASLVMERGKAYTLNFTNNYTEKKVNINYVPVTGDGGSVSRSSEELGVLTGTAQGSTPTARQGYRFEGWYKDEKCETPVDPTWVDTDNNNKLTPQKGSDGKNVAATYYAKFVPDTTTVTITKLVTGKLGDTSKKFEFECTYTGEDGKSVTEKFQLANTETKVIKARIGMGVTVTEDEYTGYTTSWSLDGGTTSTPGRTKTLTVEAPDTSKTNQNHITFINDKDTNPDTGVFLDSMPYIMALVIVAGGAAVFFLRRRKKSED